jgi:hypothetical protein
LRSLFSFRQAWLAQKEGSAPGAEESDFEAEMRRAEEAEALRQEMERAEWEEEQRQERERQEWLAKQQDKK